MALIRQADPDAHACTALVLNLSDLAAQGQALCQQARLEAERILAQARAERERQIAGAAEEGRRAGYQAGLEEGRRAGEQAGRQAALEEFRLRLEQLERAWTAALERFERDRETLLHDALGDMLRLAAIAAEMITKRVVQLEPDRVVDQLAAVLAQVARATRLVVAVHPDDLPLVQEALPGLARRCVAAEHVELTGDPALARGSCVARSANGTVDASIATQLARIVEVLLPGGGAKTQDAGS